MPRLRLEWGWVENYPIFVYMRFVNNGKWDVKVVKGVKGNQNIGETSPNAPSWFNYITKNCISRSDVYNNAINRARKLLRNGE